MPCGSDGADTPSIDGRIIRLPISCSAELGQDTQANGLTVHYLGVMKIGLYPNQAARLESSNRAKAPLLVLRAGTKFKFALVLK